MKSLRDLLIGARTASSHIPPFRTATELAHALSVLPKARYTNKRSTQAFLSQIFVGKAYLPDEFMEEIMRAVSTRVAPKAERALYLDLLVKTGANHNECLSLKKHRDVGLVARREFILLASEATYTEHWAFLSEACIETNHELMASLLAAQLAALRVIDPSSTTLDPIKFFKGFQGDGVLTRLVKPIWENQPSEVAFLYHVDSPQTALSLWHMAFNLVYSEEGGNNRAIDDSSILKKAVKRMEATDVGSQFVICSYAAPLNVLCASSVVVLNPTKELLIFSITNGWTARFSAAEAKAWNSLTHQAGKDLVEAATRIRWSDVAATIFKARTF